MDKITSFVIAMYVLFLNNIVAHPFVFLSSMFFLLVFRLGSTFGRLLEAMHFVYVTRHFDVGDPCEIEGVKMIVEDINIKTTNFLRYDNQKISYPNEVLAALPIVLFNQSPNMRDNIDFRVDASTPMGKLATVRERVKIFMEGKKDHWHPGAKVVIKDVDDMHMLNMSIRFRHIMNFDGNKTKNTRRKNVVKELVKMLEELNIEYSGL